MPGPTSSAEHKQAQFAAQLTVVAPFGLFDPFEVRIQFRLDGHAVP